MFGLRVIDSCRPYFIRHQILTLPSLFFLEVCMFAEANPTLSQRLADEVKRYKRDVSRLCTQTAKTSLWATANGLCLARFQQRLQYC